MEEPVLTAAIRDDLAEVHSLSLQLLDGGKQASIVTAIDVDSCAIEVLRGGATSYPLVMCLVPVPTIDEYRTTKSSSNDRETHFPLVEVVERLEVGFYLLDFISREKLSKLSRAKKTVLFHNKIVDKMVLNVENIQNYKKMRYKNRLFFFFCR